jgi:large subunit ribosomal protein L11
MAKELVAVVKLQLPSGQATPAPPVGPALGQHGINIGDFVKKFNDKTKGGDGIIVTCIVNVYKDRSFSFVVKTPPASVLLKRAAGLAKGAAKSGSEKVGTVTYEQIKEIAKIKLPDLNTNDIEQAAKMIEGTARNMGIIVKK